MAAGAARLRWTWGVSCVGRNSDSVLRHLRRHASCAAIAVRNRGRLSSAIAPGSDRQCGRHERRTCRRTIASPSACARELEGEVLFDRFSRGRYSTDASHYQIEPVGVVVPRTRRRRARGAWRSRARRACRCCRAAAAPRSPARRSAARWCIDFTKHLNQLVEIDAAAAHLHRRARHRARRAQPAAAADGPVVSRSTCRPPAAPPSAA